MESAVGSDGNPRGDWYCLPPGAASTGGCGTVTSVLLLEQWLDCVAKDSRVFQLAGGSRFVYIGQDLGCWVETVMSSKRGLLCARSSSGPFEPRPVL